MKRLLLSLALSLPLIHAQEVEIIDVTGRSIRVTPVSVTADTAMVKRAGDKEPIAIPLEKLTAESVKRCREAVEKAMDQAKLDAEAKLRDIRKDLFPHRAELKGGTVTIYTSAKGCGLDVAPDGKSLTLTALDGSAFSFRWMENAANPGDLREQAVRRHDSRLSALANPKEREAYRKSIEVKPCKFERFEGFSSTADSQSRQGGEYFYLGGEGKFFGAGYSAPAGAASRSGKDISESEFSRILGSISFL